MKKRRNVTVVKVVQNVLVRALNSVVDENSKSTANPCFANWLVKNAKKVNGLEKIDRDELRQKIIHSGR
jgi:hypothetical protein